MNSAADFLGGMRVLDLSRVLAGPFCCQVLADLGADVVKVERPGLGDDTRQWGPPFLNGDGPSAYYLSCNRGKRSLALDLAHPEARAVLDDLLCAADVLVENFRLGSLARLGLDPQRLATLNPRLVRVSISGFGRTGPEADVPGYDLTVQAAGGIMSITGEAGRTADESRCGDHRRAHRFIWRREALAGCLPATSGTRDRNSRQYRSAAGFDLALADCTLSALVNVAAERLGDRPAARALWQRPSANRPLRGVRDGRRISRVGDRQRRTMGAILQCGGLRGLVGRSAVRHEPGPRRASRRS